MSLPRITATAASSSLRFLARLKQKKTAYAEEKTYAQKLQAFLR